MAHPPWLKRYYRSDEWTIRKRRYYSRHNRQCAACGTWRRVSLHHLEYWGPWGDLRNPADWGKEPDQALMPLCYSGLLRKGCHNNVHRIERNFPDLRSATEHIVRLGRRRRARQKQAKRFGNWVLTAGRRTDQRSPR
jgi:hypothetical protein